jgi:hypothetical protein
MHKNFASAVSRAGLRGLFPASLYVGVFEDRGRLAARARLYLGDDIAGEAPEPRATRGTCSTVPMPVNQRRDFRRDNTFTGGAQNEYDIP